MPPNHQHSGELPDPVILLAVRAEIEGALHPMREEMRAGFQSMGNRLASGDTAIALIKQKQEAQERQALQPKTEKTKKEPNPYVMMFLSGALGALGGLAMVWFLVGVGQQAAAKGTP